MAEPSREEAEETVDGSAGTAGSLSGATPARSA